MGNNNNIAITKRITTNTIAIIPMRKGSTRIINKNFKLLNGLPLCYYAIRQCILSPLFDKVIVNTDYDIEYYNEMIEYFNKNGIKTDKKIFYMKRKIGLEKDEVKLEPVLISTIKQIENNLNYYPDIIYTIQVTNPFQYCTDYFNAYELFINYKCDSMVSCTRIKKFIWSYSNYLYKDISAMSDSYEPENRIDMKDFKGTLIENGSFYITKKDVLLKTWCRLSGDIGIYEMDNKGSYIDIDTIEDFEYAEFIMNGLNK